MAALWNPAVYYNYVLFPLKLKKEYFKTISRKNINIKHTSFAQNF